jgi:hypothetical protein
MRALAVYRARLSFYVGLILLLAAIPFSPLGRSYFMWLVVAPSVVFFLSTSLFFILLTYIQPSFRNPGEYEHLLGIRATPLWWVLCALGTAMTCTFPWTMDNPPSIPLWVSQAGLVIFLGTAQLALLRREATLHERMRHKRTS